MNDLNQAEQLAEERAELSRAANRAAAMKATTWNDLATRQAALKQAREALAEFDNDQTTQGA
jgi:hypothetical protein